MKRMLTAAALTLVVATLAISSAAAQTQVEQNPLIHIQYVPPKYMGLYERLMKRHFLEEYSQFMSPLRLKKPLTVSLEQCDILNSDYNDEKHYIRLCYEWLNMIINEAAVPQAELPAPFNDPKTHPGAGRMAGVTRAEAIIGGILQVTLHETGHAIFDIQGVPRLGREEDAADEVSGLVMLQFGTSLALTTVKGAMNTFHHLLGRFGFRMGEMADGHSIDVQRAANYLCLAYGKEPAVFEDLASQSLPAGRKANCKYEYQQALLAFQKTVMPFIDVEQLKKVQAMQILQPDDSKL